MLLQRPPGDSLVFLRDLTPQFEAIRMREPWSHHRETSSDDSQPPVVYPKSRIDGSPRLSSLALILAVETRRRVADSDSRLTADPFGIWAKHGGGPQGFYSVAQASEHLGALGFEPSRRIIIEGVRRRSRWLSGAVRSEQSLDTAIAARGTESGAGTAPG